ncbi:substrate-binding periplasmic protein [Alteromonas facilis]|uniref:substrate-binding periplasmic protein n=1 Tax=Alteromonas facilis TaxID=2048004 RepID=UPI000C28CB73|nr:transporter substrate-binding domain-containing protein [Alteromonas facilis]
MKLHLLVLCTSLLAILPYAHAERKTVVLGASLFPPSAYIDKDSGECVGENIDVSRKVLAHYDIKLEVVCTLPARMYRLIKNSEVDFTVNVKSTTDLRPYVEFVEPPLKNLIINLYRHANDNELKTISAIRGFEYNGGRQNLVDQNYRFIDLPTAEAALQLFLKRRTSALISYQSNVLHLMQQNGLSFPNEVTVTPLLEVNAYFGVAKGSEHFDLLWHAFNDYAEVNDLTYFVQLTTPE